MLAWLWSLKQVYVLAELFEVFPVDAGKLDLLLLKKLFFGVENTAEGSRAVEIGGIEVKRLIVLILVSWLKISEHVARS